VIDARCESDQSAVARRLNGIVGYVQLIDYGDDAAMPCATEHEGAGANLPLSLYVWPERGGNAASEPARIACVRHGAFSYSPNEGLASCWVRTPARNRELRVPAARAG
jgi:hypothetical protein